VYIYRYTPPSLRPCRRVKATAYTSFVRPQLEYAGTVWSPHTVNNTNSQMAAVQRRAARSVMNDWSRPYKQSGRSSPRIGSLTLMMQQMGWNTLQERRNQARVIMMYRIVNGLIIPSSLYLTYSTQSTRGHGLKFRVPAVCVSAFNHSFFPATIRIWNQLPADVVMSPAIPFFAAD